MVAIEMFFHEDLKDQDDFLSELSIIHCPHQPNVVPLLGITSGKNAVHIPAFVWHSTAGPDTMNIEMAVDPPLGEAPSGNTASRRRMPLLSAVFGISAIPCFKALEEHRPCILSDWSQAESISLNDPGCMNIDIKSDPA